MRYARKWLRWRFRQLLSALAFWPTATFPAHADMIDTSGMKAWEVCGMCHGLDGNSPMPKFPRLAGQSYGYLVKQLGDFKSGRRANDGGQMSAIAEQLSPRKMDIVARYFSGQKLSVGEARKNPAEVLARGESLFRRGAATRGIPACTSCHGIDARAGSAAARLEGQHAAYLAKQIRDFRSGARSNDVGGQMRAVAQALGDVEIEAIAAYAAGARRSTGATP